MPPNGLYEFDRDRRPHLVTKSKGQMIDELIQQIKTQRAAIDKEEKLGDYGNPDGKKKRIDDMKANISRYIQQLEDQYSYIYDEGDPRIPSTDEIGGRKSRKSRKSRRHKRKY